MKTPFFMMNSTNRSSTLVASPFGPHTSSNPIAAHELRRRLSRWLSILTLGTFKPYYPLYTSLTVPARSKSIFLLPSHPVLELLGFWSCQGAVLSCPSYLPPLLPPPH